MKKIAVLVTIVLTLSLVLVGCLKQSVNASQEDQLGQFEVIQYDTAHYLGINKYVVFVDKDTNVMYLFVDAGNNGGVTYMVNPGNTVESMIHWYQLLLGAWILAMVLSVIFTVPFALAFYFLADDPEMGGIEALKASTHAMKGHIWQYLMLELSFVPLLFLSLFTLYIGLLWLMPYMQFTETAFYMYVTGELDQQRTDRQHTGIQEISDRTGDDYNSEA